MSKSECLSFEKNVWKDVLLYVQEHTGDSSSYKLGIFTNSHFALPFP